MHLKNYIQIFDLTNLFKKNNMNKLKFLFNFFLILNFVMSYNLDNKI